MNLIDLVTQARAVVRVYEAGRLVDVVPVRYPEMLTCSSELVVDHGSAWYDKDAEVRCEVCPVKPHTLPFQVAPFSGHASMTDLSSLHLATRKGAV